MTEPEFSAAAEWADFMDRLERRSRPLPPRIEAEVEAVFYAGLTAGLRLWARAEGRHLGSEDRKLIHLALTGEVIATADSRQQGLDEEDKEGGDRRIVAGADVEPGDYVKFDPADPTRRTVVPVPRKGSEEEES